MNQSSTLNFDYEIFFAAIENEIPITEYEEIEYKSAQGGFPKEFWNTYSAYANTNAGLYS